MTLLTVWVIIAREAGKRGVLPQRKRKSEVRYFYYFLGVLPSFISPPQSVVLLFSPSVLCFSISLYANKLGNSRGAESQREMEDWGAVSKKYRKKNKRRKRERGDEGERGRESSG